jgi:hypothetical protein
MAGRRLFQTRPAVHPVVRLLQTEHASPPPSSMSLVPLTSPGALAVSQPAVHAAPSADQQSLVPHLPSSPQQHSPQPTTSRFQQPGQEHSSPSRKRPIDAVLKEEEACSSPALSASASSSLPGTQEQTLTRSHESHESRESHDSRESSESPKRLRTTTAPSSSDTDTDDEPSKRAERAAVVVNTLRKQLDESFNADKHHYQRLQAAASVHTPMKKKDITSVADGHFNSSYYTPGTVKTLMPFVWRFCKAQNWDDVHLAMFRKLDGDRYELNPLLMDVYNEWKRRSEEQRSRHHQRHKRRSPNRMDVSETVRIQGTQTELQRCLCRTSCAIKRA